jgi:hypothetical protein
MAWTKVTSDVYSENMFYLDFKKIKSYKQGIQTQTTLYKSASGHQVREFKDSKIYGHGTLTFSQPHKEAGFKYIGQFRDHKYKEITQK